MKHRVRFLSWLLAAIMLVGMVPATSVTAFAEGGTVMDRASMSAVIHEGEPYGYADVTPDDDYYTVELNDWQARCDHGP